MKTLAKLFKDESGATAIEYVLIAAVLAIGLAGVFSGFGQRLTTALSTVMDGVDAQAAGTAPTPAP